MGHQSRMAGSFADWSDGTIRMSGDTARIEKFSAQYGIRKWEDRNQAPAPQPEKFFFTQLVQGVLH
jgi:hypothetical protein